MRLAWLCGTLLTALAVGLVGVRQVLGQALVLLVVMIGNPELVVLILLIGLMLMAWYHRKAGSSGTE